MLSRPASLRQHQNRRSSLRRRLSSNRAIVRGRLTGDDLSQRLLRSLLRRQFKVARISFNVVLSVLIWSDWMLSWLVWADTVGLRAFS
jgi:hypothetical protein